MGAIDAARFGSVHELSVGTVVLGAVPLRKAFDFAALRSGRTVWGVIARRHGLAGAVSAATSTAMPRS